MKMGFCTVTAVGTTTRPRPSTRGFVANQHQWSCAACAASAMCQIAVCRRFYRFGISPCLRPSARRPLVARRGAGDPKGTPTYPSTVFCWSGTSLCVARRTARADRGPRVTLTTATHKSRTCTRGTFTPLGPRQRVSPHRKRLEDVQSELQPPPWEALEQALPSELHLHYYCLPEGRISRFRTRPQALVACGPAAASRAACKVRA